jgi:hypothetical protein
MPLTRAIACAIALAAMWISCAAAAQGVVLPWGAHTDFIAWEEFVRITAPSGNPQSHKVEFETWASDEDIYVKDPAQWPTIDAAKTLRASAQAQIHLIGRRSSAFDPARCFSPRGLPAPQGNGAATGTAFPLDGCIGEEVRRNWASFQYIVSNGLDSRAGLARAYARNLKVNLPADAVEFKGDWAKVSDAAKWLRVDEDSIRRHYYTAYASNNQVQTEVALLSFHISSKQIANWVWADFEGAMNLGRCDDIGCHDAFGTIAPDVAPNQVGGQPYGRCEKSPALQAMLRNAGIDPVWKNYCLKGTQATFVDASGKPVLLGNSVIEPLNAGIPVTKSSCITCHAYAAFDSHGDPNTFALSTPLNSPIGKLDPSKLQGSVTNDFIWGISVPGIK